MLNGQSISAVALDTIGINGLDTESSPTALSNTWFTVADNITYTQGGKVTFRDGARQGTVSLNSPIGSLVEYKDGLTTKTFVSYDGSVATLELTNRDGAFVDTHSFTGGFGSDWQWSNLNNKLLGCQVLNSPILYDGVEWAVLEDKINTSVASPKGTFEIGRKYKISDLGDNADWSGVGGLAAAAIDDIFTATTDGATLGSTAKAYPGTLIPEGVSDFNPSCSSSSYGRLWVGGLNEEKDVVYYSALLDETSWWTAAELNDAGYIDLKLVWGKDEIVAIHSFAGKLVIFGKENIAIYNNPQSILLMALDEVVRGVGCVSRDSIQAVGDDLFFLSSTGVRSLTRTAEFDKLPLKEISLTVKDDIVANLKISPSVKSTYMQREGLYLLTFVDSMVTYVFDLNYTTERETPRVTKWLWKDDRAITSLAYSERYGLLMGRRGGSVATYEGKWDVDYLGFPTPVSSNNKYSANLTTVWIDLGQGVMASILKKAILVLKGGKDTLLSIKTYKDFSIIPSLTESFEANPSMGGAPTKWSKKPGLGSSSAALAVRAQILVNLSGGGEGSDTVLDALIEEIPTGSSFMRGDISNNGFLQADDAVALDRYVGGYSFPGEPFYDWIQEHIIDYMLADLDTYRVYFATPSAEGGLYGCDVEYDYGWTGFCSSAAYSSTTSAESLMEYRNQSDCQAASTGNVWNVVQVTSGTIAQPDNCAVNPAKYAPSLGAGEKSIHLSGTAKYLKIEMEGVANGYDTSLQSLSLLYKQGKTL
jgi:hypothetical protein